MISSFGTGGESNILQHVATEEGRVRLVSGQWRYDYFLKDHLGNVRVMLADNATPLEETHYYPFGLVQRGISMQQSTVSLQNKNLYNGKELQSDLGLGQYDYGARFYDGQIGRWHNIDLFAEKYIGYSSYGYANSSPIVFRDPNGKEIWIYYGDDGKVQYKGGKLYNTDGSIYKGDDKFVTTVSNYLNTIGTTKNGSTVLTGLTDSRKAFDFRNEVVKNKDGKEIAALSFKGDSKTGGGTISAGFLMSRGSSFTEEQRVGSTAHELFHAFQYDNGERGASVNVEVGAYLFEIGVKFRLDYGSGGLGRADSDEGVKYEEASNKLIFGGKFDQIQYNIMLQNFKKGATNNASGIYNNFPINENDTNPVIKKFFPLIN